MPVTAIPFLFEFLDILAALNIPARPGPVIGEFLNGLAGNPPGVEGSDESSFEFEDEGVTSMCKLFVDEFALVEVDQVEVPVDGDMDVNRVEAGVVGADVAVDVGVGEDTRPLGTVSCSFPLVYVPPGKDPLLLSLTEWKAAKGE